jgi:hypothetical protein
MEADDDPSNGVAEYLNSGLIVLYTLQSIANGKVTSRHLLPVC